MNIYDIILQSKSLIDMRDNLRIARINDENYCDHIDLSSLPTFGGNEPDDTNEIFSWDSDNYLVPDNGETGWEIIPRDSLTDRE